MSTRAVRGPSATAARAASVAVLLLAGCNTGPTLPPLPADWDLGGNARAYHMGPLVSAGVQGPRRHAEPLFGAYDEQAARRLEDLDAVERALRRAGYGEDPRTALSVVPASGDAPAMVIAVVLGVGQAHPDLAAAVLVPTAGEAGPTDAAAMVEAARALLVALDGGGRPRAVPEGGLGPEVPEGKLMTNQPLRHTAFVFGADPAASILASGVPLPFAAVVARDLNGPADGSWPLLMERHLDPGAATPLPPDGEGPWGVTGPDPGPTGVHVLARLALVDTGIVSRPWASAEHPYRGGGEQDALLAAGVPCVRLYRGERDVENADPDAPLDDVLERERCAVAATLAVLALADCQPQDLKRSIDTLLLERRARVLGAELEAADLELAEAWNDWLLAAKDDWLRRLCLDLALDGSED